MLAVLGYLIIEWTMTEVAAFAVSLATVASLSLTAIETAQRIKKTAEDPERKQEGGT
jgi:hypothetical protein